MDKQDKIGAVVCIVSTATLILVLLISSEV